MKWTNDYGDIPRWYWVPANEIWLQDWRRTRPERERARQRARALIGVMLYGWLG